MKDVTRFRGVVVVFSQLLHKSLGNINAITFVKPSDLTNREILTPIQMYMAIAKKPAFKLFRATTDNSIIHCMYVCTHATTSEMQPRYYHKNS